MNIINKLKDILEASPYIPSVNIDYTENTIGNFGLYSTGETLIKESITGKRTYNANFVLYFFSNSEDDFNRINNTGLINKICNYLRDIYNEDVEEDNEIVGIINNIVCSNGMLFNVPGSVNDGYTYQIQIKLTYTDYNKRKEPTPEIPVVTIRGYEVTGVVEGINVTREGKTVILENDIDYYLDVTGEPVFIPAGEFLGFVLPIYI